MRALLLKYRLLLLSASFFFLTQCQLVEEEPFEPYDIFEEEDVEELLKGRTVDELLTSGDATELPMGNICATSRLFVQNERINAFDLGYKIKGTIFSDSRIGSVAVTSGEFDLFRDDEGRVVSFSGYGNAQFPKAGFLNDAVVMADLYGAQTTYASSEIFKQDNPLLPFKDGQCYFGFSLDRIDNNQNIDEPEAITNIRKSFFNYGTLFYDPQSPAVLFHGDMMVEQPDSRQETPDKTKPKPVETEPGKPKKFKPKKSKLKMISDVRVGLSLEKSFEFRPLSFSDELETKVGGTGFEPFDGSFYMAGRIGLGKYPLEFEGETVYDGSLSPEGILDLFSNGFDYGYYRQGVNGKVFFDHFLLSVFPEDMSMELGRATLQLNADPINPFLRFAGEYDIDPVSFFRNLIGVDAMNYVPSLARTGQMYVSIGQPEDWEFYMMNSLQLRIPGLGEQTSLSKSYFHFTPQLVELGGEMNLPFGLAGVAVVGRLESDGSFLLRGNANTDIQFGNGISLTGDLVVEVSNDGVFVKGDLMLPGAIAGIKVVGRITEDEIFLEGEGNVNIRFSETATLAARLHVKASSSEGIFLDGFLKTPMQVAEVAVNGEISARGLGLSGYIKGNIDYGSAALRSELRLDASTWGGARLSGMIDVPLKVIGGEMEAYGEILTANAFKLGASARVTLGFDGFASVSPMVNFAFSQAEIDIGANAEFCIADGCVDAGISFNPNWATREVEICVKPFAVELCIGN